jgi:YHS domain-containing protein
MGFFEGLKKYIATEDEKIKDPVCGMSVLKDENLKSTFRDVAYYFCSTSCREEVAKNPEKFVKNS